MTRRRRFYDHRLFRQMMITQIVSSMAPTHMISAPGLVLVSGFAAPITILAGDKLMSNLDLHGFIRDRERHHCWRGV